jgi:hypothetical protein
VRCWRKSEGNVIAQEAIQPRPYLKALLFSALFVSVMVQREAVAVIAIAVIVGLLATTRLSMTSAQTVSQAAPSRPETAKPAAV